MKAGGVQQTLPKTPTSRGTTIPVKAAMGFMGLLEPVYRLPMTPPAPANAEKIEKVLEDSGLLRKVSIAG